MPANISVKMHAPLHRKCSSGGSAHESKETNSTLALSFKENFHFQFAK